MTTERLTAADRAALNEIRRLLSHPIGTNWTMPDEYLMFAQDIAHLPPAQARARVQEYIDKIRAQNAKQRERFENAVKFRAEIVDNPLTNAGKRGVIGYFWRQILSTLNGTPLTSLNLFELTTDGLQIFQPFLTISKRTVRWRELKNNELTLSVNPPAYFDWLLGFLRQFFRNIVTPWGEIVLYERGSGRDIARAVALWPDSKIRQFRWALEQLSFAENQYEGRKREPRKVDLLTYYEVEEWDAADLPPPADETTMANIEEALDEATPPDENEAE
ncbi:MAG: hypothetical protein NT075_18770 [Chloroflexi bacterium]|nr:hypothetical protein [Chloroflexota bacterium]